MKEIYLKFAVDVVKFVFVFAIVQFEILFIHFFEVVKIIRTLRIHTFMKDKMFSAFLRNESVTTVRTSELQGRKLAFVRRKLGIADFTEKLSFGTIILVKEWFWSITTRDSNSCPGYHRQNGGGWEKSSCHSVFRSKG